MPNNITFVKRFEIKCDGNSVISQMIWPDICDLYVDTDGYQWIWLHTEASFDEYQNDSNYFTDKYDINGIEENHGK